MLQLIISKPALIEKVWEICGKTKYTKKDVQAIVQTTFDTISREVFENKADVRIHRFGTFRLKTIAARERYNPVTKEPFDSKESVKLSFRGTAKGPEAAKNGDKE